MNQQEEHHLGPCWKCRISGHSANLQNQIQILCSQHPQVICMHRAGKRANASFIPNLTDRPEMYERIEAKKGKTESISLECVIEELWYFSVLYLVRGRGELKQKYSERLWPNFFLLEFMQISTGKRLARRLWLHDQVVALRTNCTKPNSGWLMCFLSVDQTWGMNQGAACSCYESCPRIPPWRDTFKGWGIQNWMPEAGEGIWAGLVGLMLHLEDSGWKDLEGTSQTNTEVARERQSQPWKGETPRRYHPRLHFIRDLTFTHQ